jgi:uncharacterized damage-inducible protein DinB
MNEQSLQRDILLAFEYSFLHADWVNPLEEALAGVTADQALSKPSADAKSIWDIVLHMTVWTENIVERIRSGNPVRPSEGAWPLLPTVRDEAAWEGAKSRLRDALDSLRSTIEAAPLTAIEDSPYGLADLLCRFIHNAYHIGQITKMREYLGQQAR